MTPIEQIKEFKREIRTLVNGISSSRRANNLINDGWCCVVLQKEGGLVTKITPDILAVCTPFKSGSLSISFTPKYDDKGDRVCVWAKAIKLT